MHPPRAPSPPPRSRSQELSAASTVLSAVLRVWPILLVVVPAGVGLLLETRSTAAAVIRLEAALAAKADLSELGHTREELRELVARYQRDEDRRDAREQRLADSLATIQRDLERVCARVQCGR